MTVGYSGLLERVGVEHQLIYPEPTGTAIRMNNGY